MATGLLSPAHLAILLAVLLMMFGAKRLPEMGRALGSGLRGFKESLEGPADASEPDDRHGRRAASTVSLPPPEPTKGAGEHVPFDPAA